MNGSRKQVVIIGGSFGGVNAAYELHRQLGRAADITLISKDAEFTFLPSLPWVILGWRRPDSLLVPLDKPLRRKGVRFVMRRSNTWIPIRAKSRPVPKHFGTMPH
jgi:sulfide:quinone oxidoreductase